LWAAGAIMILPLASGGLIPAGRASVGVFLSLIAWGFALGAAYPFVHRPLHERTESAARRMGPNVGTPKTGARDR
jgi:hypothetical protein